MGGVWDWVFAVLLGGALALGGTALYLEVDGRRADAEPASASLDAMGSLTVVGGSVRRVDVGASVTDQVYCVDYRAYGKTESICISATLGAGSAVSECFGQTAIGRRVPTCWGVPTAIDLILNP